MPETRTVVIIGGGPAGLMAAETLACQALAGKDRRPLRIELFDAMPSLGRKFLMAGKGGMNITHSEPAAAFGARYGKRAADLAPLLAAFGADAVRAWIDGLGLSTFVGSSGRVFPTDMKAAPLLRAWLQRLRGAGVRFHVRHRWHALTRSANCHYQLAFSTPAGEVCCEAEAVILALGGGSWPQLGSDGRWVPLLTAAGLPVAPLRPANCGFEIDWSEHLRAHFAGQPLKNVGACFTDASGTTHQRQGEALITASGIEGGLIYALSAPLRDALEATGSAILHLDLLPGHTAQRVAAEVAHARGSRSLSSHLHSRLGLKGVKMALLHECLSRAEMNDPPILAAAIKALPLRLHAPRPLAEAISSAGGVLFEALDRHLMSRTLPGLFCAGEMLDWEAPTGGYLLTACLACGRAAGQGALEWMNRVR
jgi:uncharacterized flavoprotein (TIGR03862 family)